MIAAEIGVALHTKARVYILPCIPGNVDADNDEKILAEREISRHSDLPATILRLPVVYGPGDYMHRFFPTLRRIDDKRPALLLECRAGDR